MKTLSQKPKSKALISFAALVLTFIASFLFSCVSQPAFAWGPADRETFTMELPATFRTFNSITNNPSIGDERNFVRIREAGVGTFGDEVELIPGKEYEIFIYFHNNATVDLNPSGAGIAQNVRVYSSFPAVVQPGEQGIISGVISSSNTTPARIWDEAYVTAASAVSLRYIPASAIIHSAGAINGRILSTNLFNDPGTFLGFNELNGILPGCSEFTGHVIYRLVADQPNFEISKSVSKENVNDWQNSVFAQPGDILEFRLHYRNTGTIDQADVTLIDTLPSFLEYIPGSTKLINNSDPTGSFIADGITTTGINIGLYGPGAEATISYKARLANSESLPCGSSTLQNTIAAITGNGTKRDSAYVNVTNESDNCIDTPNAGGTDPEIPATLPVTGPLEVVTVITALLALTIGLVYWYNSHIAVQKAARAVRHSKSSAEEHHSAHKAHHHETTTHHEDNKPTDQN